MTGQDISQDGISFNDLGRGDIKRARFGAPIRPDQSFHGNFVECYFEDLVLSNIDFARCDWKDCRASSVRFVNCDLTHASMITNSFESCSFVNCRFEDTGISDCQFTNCSFLDSDFEHLIVKSGRFDDCQFERCVVSNRIIESSLILNSRWLDMDIEVGLITGNFGLKERDLSGCALVRFGQDRQRRALSLDEVISSENWSTLERFRFSYFRSGSVEADAALLEKATDPRHWTGDASIQASLGALLSLFAQFLLAEFENNAMTFYPLLRFHTNNFALLDWLTQRHHLSQLYQTVAGVHLTLTREVDAFLDVVETRVALLSSSDEIHLAAEGPAQVGYFASLFADVKFDGISVLAVRPRNSPVDVALAVSNHPWLVGLVALVLSTKTKLELQSLEKGQPVSPGAQAQDVPQTSQLVAVKTGFLESSNSNIFSISIRAVMPRSLLLDLHLDIDFSLIKRVREAFFVFISGSHPEQQTPPSQGPRQT